MGLQKKKGRNWKGREGKGKEISVCKSHDLISRKHQINHQNTNLNLAKLSKN
jgi:hypothetical protein